MALSRDKAKQTPFSVLVLSGTVDNENGVIRKFHPGFKDPMILKVPGDISYRNAGRHIAANRMEYINPEAVEALKPAKDTKRELASSSK